MRTGTHHGPGYHFLPIGLGLQVPSKKPLYAPCISWVLPPPPTRLPAWPASRGLHREQPQFKLLE